MTPKIKKKVEKDIEVEDEDVDIEIEEESSDDDDIVGFVGRSSTGMHRSRSSVSFWPTDHFYEGRPTEEMLDDRYLSISLVRRRPENVPPAQKGMDQLRKEIAERQQVAQGVAEGVSRELDSKRTRHKNHDVPMEY